MNGITFTNLNLNDLDGVHSLWSDEAATLFTNFPYLPTKEECRQRLEKMMSYYGQSADHFGPYVIRATNGIFLGLTGGDADNSALGTYEIWYFVRRDYWGKKVATSAVKHLLEIMKNSSRTKIIRAEAVVDNEPSWRFLEKLGFVRSGGIAAGHRKNGKTWDRYAYTLPVT